MKNEMHDMNEKELLKQLRAANFMKVDLGLFLNTHPMDGEALKEFNFYVMECRRLKEAYEMHCGMLTQHDSLSPYPWQWICEPWPWEEEANSKLEREEK
ncbi:spore coat protein CotJB [Clostridium paridis]|uniref:Spore coat protein CotJB n=1 Tax=Clostridium paridis TaxID=2803863 RepID=A0A937FB63_9CLOT|nr:spore coat protein CotJB [Clostridium paridis]MBL4930699.1 spore coat protein CotJB [Clostridium paridis]